jgi:hypothetical protein
MTLVAPVTDHLSVAVWPRSTVLGSTVNETIDGRPENVLDSVLGPLGAGVRLGGGAGAFLEQPTPSAANRIIALKPPRKLTLDINKTSKTEYG